MKKETIDKMVKELGKRVCCLRHVDYFIYERDMSAEDFCRIVKAYYKGPLMKKADPERKNADWDDCELNLFADLERRLDNEEEVRKVIKFFPTYLKKKLKKK